MTKTTLHKLLLGWLPVEWQDTIGTWHRYHLHGNKGTGNAIIARVDGSTFHGGLADRWKGIVSLYAFAKATGREFRIDYTFPFELTEFQIPASYDWRLQEGELSDRVSRVCLKRVTAQPTFDRMIRLPHDKQIHCYANRDWVEAINQQFHTSYTWGGLFNELFLPSQRLLKAMDTYRSKLGDTYIAVAFRLQNLFGDFKEYDYEPATPTRQQEILNLCRSYLQALHRRTQKPILVTSDSQRFTQEIAELPFIICTNGKAAHADTLRNAPDEQYLKSFVDFYLLASAQEIYCAGTEEMYPSEFPLYAAKVNNRPFYRERLS